MLIISKNLPSLSKEELKSYAELLCYLTVLDVKQIGKFEGGSYVSNSISFLEVFEIDNLASYSINHEGFSKSYEAYIENMQQHFPEILKEWRKMAP